MRTLCRPQQYKHRGSVMFYIFYTPYHQAQSSMSIGTFSMHKDCGNREIRGLAVSKSAHGQHKVSHIRYSAMRSHWCNISQAFILKPTTITDQAQWNQFTQIFSDFFKQTKPQMLPLGQGIVVGKWGIFISFGCGSNHIKGMDQPVVIF